MITSTFKCLSRLLTYPDGNLLAGLDQIYKQLEADKNLSDSDLNLISKLICKLKTTDLIDLQEEYVNLFDRSPSLSLYLFEHVYGESRDRGQAMVDLIEIYKKNGFVINNNELPDYIPMFLEYLSEVDQQEALDLLAEPIHVLTILRGRLKQRKSEYVAIFNAIVNLSPVKANKFITNKALMKKQDDGNDRELLDKKWKEAPIF